MSEVNQHPSKKATIQMGDNYYALPRHTATRNRI